MNAIIAAAAGYGEADLRLFLSSVERNCEKTKVFLIVHGWDKTIESLQGKYQCLEFVPIRKKVIRGVRFLNPIFHYLSRKDYPSLNPLLKYLGRNKLHIKFERYFMALKLVRAYGDSFSNILLSDSRDVIIQSNPFDLINGKLVLGVEEEIIGNCPCNSDWIRKTYGERVLSQMLDRRIVCSGVTLGPTKEVDNYLSQMCGEIWRCLPKTGCSGDQGLHNYLVFKGLNIPFELADNREGLIATLAHEKPINIMKKPANGLVQVHGNYPAIVHQYDRHPDLVEFLKESPALQLQ